MAQNSLDSLQRDLITHPDDSSKVDVLNRIAFLNLAYSLDAMELYARKAIALGEKLDYQRGVAEGYKNLGVAYYSKGSYQLGLEQLFKALKISEQLGDKRNMARALHNIGGTYFYQEDFTRALEFTKRSIEMFRSVDDAEGEASSQLSVCECHLRLQEPDQATTYCEKALQFFKKSGNKERQAHAMLYLGGIYKLKKQNSLALQAYWSASKLVNEGSFLSVGVYLNHDLGKFYMESNKYDSASYYLHKSLTQLRHYTSKDALMQVYQTLSEFHERTKHYDSALYYSRQYIDATRKDFNLRRNDQLAALETHYNLEITSRELQLNQQVLKSQQNLLIFAGIILTVVLISTILIFSLYLKYRTANRQLTELNFSINEKNDEISAQSDELQTVNSAMQQINANLESIVEERTREVKMQNEKLIEYAYFNAHKVRGPLARILGLVSLLKLEELSPWIKEFTDKMEDSASELDQVIHEINKKLDTD
jgi:tetratricopeptide (TPR) repeat protein